MSMMFVCSMILTTSSRAAKNHDSMILDVLGGRFIDERSVSTCLELQVGLDDFHLLYNSRYKWRNESLTYINSTISFG